MALFRKHLLLLSAVFLIVLYIITRFYNILGLPIFTDEAIYIRWSQIALNDPDWRFISLTDGKQPMFVWIAMIFLKFIDEPLLAGRLVSILAGFFTTVGIYFLTKEIFKSKKTAILACFLYILFPFALVYDRIALYDSLIAMFIIWSLYFEILLIRNNRLDLALILGFLIGGGMLTKSSAQFSLILLPFSLLLFNFKQKNIRLKLIRWLLFASASVILSIIIYNLLRFSPFFYIIDQKNHLFIYTFQEWFQNPLLVLFKNLSVFTEWIIDYSTIPFLILVISAIIIKSKFRKAIILLYLWFLIPLISTAFFGRLVYPRYLLFMVLPLIPVAAYTLMYITGIIRNLWLKSAVVLVFILMFLIKDYYIITDFKNAPIPRSDKGQYITGWPSGVGVEETVKFLENESKKQKIYVGTQGTFGLMPFALEIYFKDNPNIEVVGYWPAKENPPADVLKIASKMPVYFVFYQSCPNCLKTGVAPSLWPVKEIFQIEKAEKGNYYTLYKINKNE